MKILKYLLIFLLFGLFNIYTKDIPQVEEIINTIISEKEITETTRLYQQKLNQAINKMIDAGHLAPGYFCKGIASPKADWLWYNPAELVYTLSISLPYLEADLKVKAIEYLHREMQAYAPLKCGVFDAAYKRWDSPPTWIDGHYPDPGDKHDPFHAGTRREYFPISPLVIKNSPNIWPPIKPEMESIYSIWLYSVKSDDWKYAEHNMPQIKAMFFEYIGRKENDKDFFFRYPHISGLIGVMRIAEHFKENELYEKSRKLVIEALKSIKFEDILKTEKKITAAGHNYFITPFLVNIKTVKAGLISGHFSPECALYLKYYDMEAVEIFYNDFIKRQPLWHLTRGFNKVAFGGTDGRGSGENSHFTPDVAWSLFMIRAYVYSDSQSELIELLDEPAMLGDLFYIQKLVTIIEADI